jgi:hypothetical protein
LDVLIIPHFAFSEQAIIPRKALASTAITNAINETSFIQEAENTESMWSHCVGIP